MPAIIFWLVYWLALNLFSKILYAHGRALNVPAGPAFAPRRIPKRLDKFLACRPSSRYLGFLPEDKIQRILFIGIQGEISPVIGDFQHCSVAESGKLAKFFVAFNIKIHRTIDFVGQAFAD